MRYTNGIEFMKACIIMQRTERMAAQMDAKEKATHIVRSCEDKGHKFRAGAIEAVAAALIPGEDYENVVAAVNEYRIPPCIEMPWGIRVTP